MLTIVLHRIGFDGRHGATAVERRGTRKFEVDVELDADVARGGDAAIAWRTPSTTARWPRSSSRVGTGEPHHLLESLARRMVDAVRARFPSVRRMRLELRKLNPPTCPGHPAYSAVRLELGSEAATRG